jgi:hypothetical protein
VANIGIRLVGDSSVVIGASETNTPVTLPTRAINVAALRISIKVSSVTASAGITAKLQDSSFEGVWNDVASAEVNITANGIFEIVMNPDDSALPLRDRLRVVVSSGAGDAVTVDSVVATKIGG